MPDFTVIDGGGSPVDWAARDAENAFCRLVMELLRALARGDDHGRHLPDLIGAFLKHDSESKTPTAATINNAVQFIHALALSEDFETSSFSDMTTKNILKTSLRVTAESIAADGFAKGRRSQQLTSLQNSIDQNIVEHERRARENGWSYVDNLTTHLPKVQPRKSAKKTKIKPVPPK